MNKQYKEYLEYCSNLDNTEYASLWENYEEDGILNLRSFLSNIKLTLESIKWSFIWKYRAIKKRIKKIIFKL